MPFRLILNIASGLTTNRTEVNPGYDVVRIPSGNLTWLQMKREGYEADKMTLLLILMA
jgi:hypothetical protein